jgi:diaminohydroxyphosphoribosylaminopyrimidine deaminase/5-amino-6-(5-phosphoribosylamino)uracil reductase
VRTAAGAPLLVATGPAADPAWVNQIRAAGAEVWIGPDAPDGRLPALLAELGRRRCSNILLEGGASLLHAAFAAGVVDEAWVFVTDCAPAASDPAVAIHDVRGLSIDTVDIVGGDILVRGRVGTSVAAPPGGVTPGACRGSRSASG